MDRVIDGYKKTYTKMEKYTETNAGYNPRCRSRETTICRDRCIHSQRDTGEEGRERDRYMKR